MHPYYGPSSQIFLQGYSWWPGLVSMVMYLLFWSIVVVIAIKLVNRYLITTKDSDNRQDAAMQILRERYAKGEIDAEEFRHKKADLESG